MLGRLCIAEGRSGCPSSVRAQSLPCQRLWLGNVCRGLSSFPESWTCSPEVEGTLVNTARGRVQQSVHLEIAEMPWWSLRNTGKEGSSEMQQSQGKLRQQQGRFIRWANKKLFPFTRVVWDWEWDQRKAGSNAIEVKMAQGLLDQRGLSV